MILLAGDWDDCPELIGLLTIAGNTVSYQPGPELAPAAYDLAIIRTANPQVFSKFCGISAAWLAWCLADELELVTQAYQCGATAAFPKDTPLQVIQQIIENTLMHGPHNNGKQAGDTIQRRYQRGDIILLEADTVLEIGRGVIAQTMVHQDGSEVLLGLCGPDQLLIPHPADTCYIQLVSQTDSMVVIKSWERASHDPEFADKLRSRLQQMEAWAAMQARPHVDQRVFGILSLLAEQFGIPTPEGRMVDIRITHTQLASAVGATRTTITRTLGDMRRQGVLSMISTADGERYCLTRWEQGDHSIHLNGH